MILLTPIEKSCAECNRSFMAVRRTQMYCGRKCQKCIAHPRPGPGKFTTHGHTKSKRSRPPTATYRCWSGMIQRCRNPKNRAFRNYGMRGIGVCESWLKFENFLADMGEKPDGLTLDRVDNDRGYEPGNCAWRTRAEQQQNTRLTKLTPDVVNEIRGRAEHGEGHRSIARRFSISHGRVGEVIARTTWKNVP